MRIKVSAIQLQAFNLNQADRALTESLNLIDKAAVDKPDLVVLPECTYPGYFLGYSGNATAALQDLAAAVEAYCRKARQHGFHLIAGLPLLQGDQIFNAAYLINPDGEIIGTAEKSFLWHFDSKWFGAGKRFNVFDTPLGRIGMIVCADGRQPEIARILALDGAQIIVDVTNWVTTGADKHRLTNPQYEYILPSRAMENRVWCVAANKVGMEADSIIYCGKSCIISPVGEIVATAGSDEQAIVSAEIDLGESNNKNIDEVFDIHKNRNPRVYQAIADKSENLPVANIVKEKICPGDMTCFISTVQLDDATSLEGYFQKSRSIVAMMALQGSRIIVFPELSCLGDAAAAKKIIDHAAALAAEYSVIVVTSAVRTREGAAYKVSLMAEPEGAVHFYEKTHLDRNEQKKFRPGQSLTVWNTRFGHIGLMLGYEGWIPEVCRCLMLKGADLICWQTHMAGDRHVAIARTRSAENKVNVVVANTWGAKTGGKSLIIGPGGVPAAQAFADGNQIVSSLVDMASARVKLVVPGTNVLTDRAPETCRRLLEV